MVCLVCAIPYLSTVIIAVAMGLAVSPGWTSPVSTILPVVIAGLLAAPTQVMRTIIARTCLAACLVIPLAGPLVLYLNFNSGSPAAVVPRAEIVRDAAAFWSAATGLPLEIIGPDQPLANTAGLELPSRPMSWPAFSDAATWITPDMVDRHGVLVLCPSDVAQCRDKALVRAPHGIACQLRNARTLWGRQGPVFVTDVYIVPPRNVPLNMAAISRACQDATAGAKSRAERLPPRGTSHVLLVAG